MSWPEYVLGAFERCRKRQNCPDRWEALCPLHEDRRPSLDVYFNRQTGRILIRCRACRESAPIEAIVSAVGLKMTDLFQKTDGPYGERVYQSPRREVACYPYHDEDANLLYETVRYEPKDFRQRRPDGHGGWIWNLSGVRRVLFRLPDLMAFPRDPVVLVEGEKDVLNLNRIGILATCNVGGTGMGWLDDYSRFLARRHVAIIADNDHSGLSHADRVAGSLLRHGIISLRIMTMPGAKDVTDWLALPGSDRDSFLSLVRSQTCYKPKV